MSDNDPAVQSTWEKVAIFAFGVVFVTAILVLAVFFPAPTAFQYLVFRVVLALAAAGVAALIPGLLKVSVGSSVRAGGALAAFVIVYFFSPAALVANPPQKTQLSRLINERQSGEISSLVQAEGAYWFANKGRSTELARLQKCVADTTCDAEDLQRFISDTVLNEDSEEARTRVVKISGFYMGVADQAKRGAIYIADACACFGQEIENWQRSYFFLLDKLSQMNGINPGYQEVLSEFSLRTCSVEAVNGICLG